MTHLVSRLRSSWYRSGLEDRIVLRMERGGADHWVSYPQYGIVRLGHAWERSADCHSLPIAAKCPFQQLMFSQDSKEACSDDDESSDYHIEPYVFAEQGHGKNDVED